MFSSLDVWSVLAAENNVRFGSKADMNACPRYVRFTPDSGHVRCKEGCPLCALSGLMHRSKPVCLFDQLIGP